MQFGAVGACLEAKIEVKLSQVEARVSQLEVKVDHLHEMHRLEKGVER